MPTLVGRSAEKCSLTSMPDLSGLPLLGALFVGGNNFTTISSLNFAVNNPRLRHLRLNDSSSLTSLPAISVKMTSGGAVETFAVLDLSNCPNLTWTSPVAWRAMDLGLGDLLDNGNYSPVLGEENKGRVAICRTNSPKVSLGK